MYKYYLKELIEKKEMQDKRKYTILELSAITKVPRPTLTKLKDSYIHKDMEIVVTTETLEKLLIFFNCKSMSELIEYIP